ncbi:hypothetical protein D4764_15G0009050 [Takifugu flavidus]|uniref:Uncharacterized protein n=1 Tax=Takifugu flavidus TaxID=433684 RepID=A0A5C6P415_9TELE|nr:hypothetical protein D4764_15G0009050 [Takifugu flavidus]
MRQLTQALMEPAEVAVVKCKGHSKENSLEGRVPWQEYDFGPGHLEKIMDKKDHTNTKGGWKKKMGSSKKKDWIGLN